MKEETKQRKERNEKAIRRQNIDRIKSERQDVRKRMNPLEAAAYLGVSTNTLSNWRWQSKGPAYIKVGHLVFYETTSLDAYERRINP